MIHPTPDASACEAAEATSTPRWCRPGSPAWPTEANDWNRGKSCTNCDATGERLQPVGPDGLGELWCYACMIGDRPERPAQGTLLGALSLHGVA